MGLLVFLLVFSPYFWLLYVMARGPDTSWRKATPAPYFPSGPDNPRLYCGCGWIGHMNYLSEDGHCPNCGYSNDLLTWQEQKDYQNDF